VLVSYLDVKDEVGHVIMVLGRGRGPFPQLPIARLLLLGVFQGRAGTHFSLRRFLRDHTPLRTSVLFLDTPTPRAAEPDRSQPYRERPKCALPHSRVQRPKRDGTPAQANSEKQ
jgi:hypothetical protein